MIMPTVSVIMSLYNPKNYLILEKSVESIISQTFTDWELIICNDGSTDKKLINELKKIKKLDTRIRLVGYSENKGAAFARNYAVKFSKGNYLAIQDSDDISLNNRLEKEVMFLNKNTEYSFVGSNANVFDENGIWGQYKVPEKPTKKSFLWNSPFANPTIMIKKSVFLDINGYQIYSFTKLCEDYGMFFELYSKGYKGYNIQETLCNYRIENSKNNKYRSMKDRIGETRIRFQGYRKLKILFLGIPYIIKPIILGLIPQKIYYKIRKMQH